MKTYDLQCAHFHTKFTTAQQQSANNSCARPVEQVDRSHFCISKALLSKYALRPAKLSTKIIYILAFLYTENFRNKDRSGNVTYVLAQDVELDFEFGPVPEFVSGRPLLYLISTKSGNKSGSTDKNSFTLLQHRFL